MVIVDGAIPDEGVSPDKHANVQQCAFACFGQGSRAS